MSHPASRRFLAAAVLVTITAASCGTGDDGATSPTSTTASAQPHASTTTTATPDPEMRTITAAFSAGAPEGGVRTETVTLGEEIRLEVTGDTEAQVHLHGYDRFARVSPGSPAVIELTADIPGVFEVELEEPHLLLLELQVEP